MRVLSIAFALAVVSNAAVGGAEQILARLDRALVAAGHDSLVVAPEGSQVCGTLFASALVPMPIAPDHYRFRHAEHSRRIEEALNSCPVDLIHMHGLDFHEFLPQVDIPILATLHLPPQWYAAWIYQARRPNLYLNCVSESQRAAVPESAAIIETIHNGVDIPPLEALPVSARKGAVMLGRICPEKGIHIGLAAAKCAGMPLTIAGQVFGYPEHLRYFQEEVQPALNHTIAYCGPVAGRRKIELLRSAKCLLVPSTAPETSSLVSMEALACGTPVIAMRSGALPEIVEHGKTGFIVDTSDMMSKAMSHLDEIDPMTCRRTAMRRFSAERMSREYMKLYQELTGHRWPVLVSSGEHRVRT